MLTINSLDDVRGNNVVIYSIKKLLANRTYPTFSIMSGNMGVGKSTVARLVAEALNMSEAPVHIYNFGMDINMKELEETVFKMNPSEPRAFVFEELHGLDKSQQTALLTMLDSQPSNVYIICTTTEIYKVLRTIRSRAHVWEFRLLGERQLAQLLDDYLEAEGITNFSKTAKSVLLKSARGVPRDLLKNTDIAIAGEFNSENLNQLLGQVSEDLIFALFCSLKTQSVEFTSNISQLMDEGSEHKLAQLRDFWTRYLLEQRGIDNPTISKDKLEQLSLLFSVDEAIKVARTLIRATEDTLMLELVALNMELTKTSAGYQVGQQKDKRAQGTAQGIVTAPSEAVARRKENARISPISLDGYQLNSSKEK